MTTQTMFDSTERTTLAKRLEGTPLDPSKGRAREYRVIFALTVLVLVMVLGASRLLSMASRSSASRRSIVHEAMATARSALPFAYRH